MARTVGCIGGNEMKGAKSEKRKKNQTQANSCLSIKTWPFIVKTHEASWRGKTSDGNSRKEKKDGKLNFITTFALPPFPERGAVKEVIYIYGKRTVAIFLDTWLIDGISSACS